MHLRGGAEEVKKNKGTREPAACTKQKGNDQQLIHAFAKGHDTRLNAHPTWLSDSKSNHHR